MNWGKIWQQIITNKNQGRISVSNLQMTTPYYPESVLAKSKFHGFYILFYMFTLYFSVVFPALNYLRTGTFFEKAYIKIIQTNIYWDIISVFIFILLSLSLMYISNFTKLLYSKMTTKQISILFIGEVGFLWVLYIGIGLYIVRNYPMYFTDKIFIVVISWAFFIKTMSFIFDMHEIKQINSKFQVERIELQQASSTNVMNNNQKGKIKQKSISKKKIRINERAQNQQASQPSQTSLSTSQPQILHQLALIKKTSNLMFESKRTKLKIKLVYLISPEIIFKKFIMNYDQTLSIHPIYIINKFLVALICMLVNLIIMIEMIQPLCEKESLEKYWFIELFFRLIPPIFYVNICLYFMILQNIVPAIAEVTKLRDRIYYDDWWNAETIYDFLDKWALPINSFTKQYLTVLWSNRRMRQTIHVAVVMFLTFQIFNISDKPVSIFPLVLLSFVILALIYCLGGIKQIQNNYLVHIIIFSFSPLTLALQMKYKVFTGEN